MRYELNLPKDASQMEETYKQLVSAGRQARHIPEINWWLIHHYMQGARSFTNVNYQQGTLDISYIDDDGILKFRYDDIVSKFQAQIGRLMQIDLRPRVTTKSVGLGDLRKASIAQVALDYAIPQSDIDQLKLDALPPLLKYGAIALAVWNDGEDIGIDVVMPWELIPIPPNPVEDKDTRGLMRVRVVPLEWVQSLDVVPAKKAKVWNEMMKFTYPTGQKPAENTNQFNSLGISTIGGGNYPGSGTTFGVKGKDETHSEMVEFGEIWTWDGVGYLKEYVIMAGGKQLFKVSYAGRRFIVPIQKLNDIKTGNYWGRSFCSIQLPMNQELEYTIGRVFQNIQDIDTYGMLLEPTTLGIPANIMRGDDGIKRVRYEPDYTAPNLKPENIKPANTGLWPVKGVQMGVELADKMANQPTALMGGDAPGRVDSQVGLGFLYEVSNTPLTPTAASLSTAIINCYRAILNIIQIKWTNQKLVKVTMLDDTLAGIKLDPVSGTMGLDTNSIPHPDEVNIAVRAMLPKSVEQEKMELMKALEIGAIDMFEYRIEIRKRGIELPVGNEGEWQNYRRSVLENIVLFGDGETPGQVILSDRDIHEIHMRILQGFMARPEFYQATSKVRDAFVLHYEGHALGIAGMPEQAPYPEGAAEEQEELQKAGMIPG